MWASSLDAQHDRAEGHLLRAMLLLLADWQTERANNLKERAIACEETPLRSLALGVLAWDQGDALTAERWLTDAVERPAPGDEASTVLAAALAHLSILKSTHGRPTEAIDDTKRALGFRPKERQAEHYAWAARSMGEALLHGGLAGLNCLRERLPEPPERVPASDTYLLVIRGALGYYAGQSSAATADLRAAIQLARDGPATMQLPRAHVHLAQLLLNTGDWDEALLHARISLSLMSDERIMWIEAQAHAVLGTLLAYRGEFGPAREHIDTASTAAASEPTLEAVFTSRIAQAALARAQGHPKRVIEELTPMADRSTMVSPLAWWPSLVVATLDIGNVERASLLVNQLENAARERGLDLGARVTGLRARKLPSLGGIPMRRSHFSEMRLTCSAQTTRCSIGPCSIAPSGASSVTRGNGAKRSTSYAWPTSCSPRPAPSHLCLWWRLISKRVESVAAPRGLGDPDRHSLSRTARTMLSHWCQGE